MESMQNPHAMREIMERQIAHGLMNDAKRGGGRTTSGVHGMRGDTWARVKGYLEETAFKCRAAFSGDEGRIEVIAPYLGAGQLPTFPVPNIGMPFDNSHMHRPQTPAETVLDQILPGSLTWDRRVEEAIAIDMHRRACQNGLDTTTFLGFDSDALDTIKEILTNSDLIVMTRHDAHTTMTCQQK